MGASNEPTWHAHLRGDVRGRSSRLMGAWRDVRCGAAGLFCTVDMGVAIASGLPGLDGPGVGRRTGQGTVCGLDPGWGARFALVAPARLVVDDEDGGV